MTTVIDTNVLIALWDSDHTLNSLARAGLDAAFQRGSLLITAPVYAELMASPNRSEAFLDNFLQDTGIGVEWNMDERIWRAAGMAFPAVRFPREKTARLRATPDPRRLPHWGLRTSDPLPPAYAGRSILSN